MKFIIEGKPQGKDRPRFRKIGNYVKTYNTKSTKEYEELVKKTVLEQCKEQFDEEYKGPVKVFISAYFKPNKSISRKQYNLLIGQPCLKKPDGDNISKIICDALNGIVYHDDNQVYELRVYKYYAEDERVEVEIYYDTK